MSRGTISRLVDRLDHLVDAVGRLVAWFALALVALVAANVLARYLFSMGNVALQELEWHVMAVLALIGISYGINRGEEVRVDMLYARFSPRSKAFVDAIAAILTFLVAAIMFKLSLAYVGQSYRLLEGSPDPGGLPYRFILKSFLPIGFALLAAQGIVELAKAVGKLTGSRNIQSQPGVTTNGK